MPSTPVRRSSDFLADMLRRARSDMSDSVELVCSSIAVGDMHAVRSAAHALKGVANEIGAVRLATLAQALMRADDETLEQRRLRIAEDMRETATATFSAIDEIVQNEERAASGF